MFTLTLLFAAQAGTATPPPVATIVPACRQAPRTVGGKAGAKPHTLAAEPPARQIYTVLREEGGCTKPVPVNDRVIGNTGR